MIFPLTAGKLILASGLVSCRCCQPDPPDPGIDILIATATSAGGKLGCAMGDVVKTFENPPPYALAVGTYQLRVDFTTGDELYHVGSFYELQLAFAPDTVAVEWETTALGTGGNPWVVTDSGKTLRYNVEDSANCGGSNAEIQSGTALATITVTEATDMGFDFDGWAELQDTGYENISFYLRNL